MNSRDRREPLDSLEILIRQSLHERTGQRLPRPDVRRSLLQRAGRQQRRMAFRVPLSLSTLFVESPTRLSPATAENHMLYLESIFGLRLGWFTYNQLMR